MYATKGENPAWKRVAPAVDPLPIVSIGGQPAAGEDAGGDEDGIQNKTLNLGDLLRYRRSHRHAKEIIGDSQLQKRKHWDPVFTGYEWMNDDQLLGWTPALIYNPTRTYVYLYLAKKKGDDLPEKQTTESEVEQEYKAKAALIDKIKKSLHSTDRGTEPLEIRFNRFTLNISNVLFAGTHLLGDKLFQQPSKEGLEVAIWGEGARTIKPVVFGNELSIIDIPGFNRSYFTNATIDCEPWHVYGLGGSCVCIS
ncbi:hypothetical protein FALBO_1565 [Fusarium albosuccineum]|uniref:Uncharacterized protein n=1 Tax=Fusarium albosuccineum TaxID=1237068 RepID=A0A8H4LLP8_9HYPO|nr:hypothetical protein FALBO_1565 [Fusarium albosuccineum]